MRFQVQGCCGGFIIKLVRRTRFGRCVSVYLSSFMHHRLAFWILASVSLVGSAFAVELEGTRAAATTACPSPEEAQKLMAVPDGYEVRCFAHEPMIINPVAMSWDNRGRLWVVEAYEYPEGTKLANPPFSGEAKDDQYHPMPKLDARHPMDRVVILEDTDNDGVADKRTVFVEGLNLASAIICGDDGVYVGQQPHLLHFRDNNHDDKPDEWRVVLTGFGREDTHELVNSFCWGPDGWLYMTHGVFTNSKVRRPGEPKDKGFKFDAGIGRARPSTTGKAAPWEFEVFADGTSNPWGCDYDEKGNFFVSACVIDHFFHMSPGGIYVRQGGAPENPYSYELLPSIVHHKHFRAAYAGVQIYQGGVYPKDTWGHAFIGNIHDNAIHEEVLTPVGSTFKCEPRRDFLRANNGWFRPVSTKTGPDGNLWIMDWCDKYPCYQNAKANPEGVDREKGRIWRVVRTKGNEDASRPTKDMDLSKLDAPALVNLLGDSNNWMGRFARREIGERLSPSFAGFTTLNEQDERTKRRRQAMTFLVALISNQNLPAWHRLEALRTYFSISDADLPGWISGKSVAASLQDWEFNPDQLASDKDPGIRQGLATYIADKFTAYRGSLNVDGQVLRPKLDILKRLSEDQNPAVLAACAHCWRAITTGSLTTDKDAVGPWPGEFDRLLKAASHTSDPVLADLIWLAIEHPLSRAGEGEGKAFGEWTEWMMDSQPLSHVLTYKSMRRLCDTRKRENLDLALDFLAKIKAHDIILAHALDGLEKGQENGTLKPTKDFSSLFAGFATSANADVRKHALNLGVLWGDPKAMQAFVAIMLDAKADESKRIAALQSLRRVKSEAAKQGFAKVWTASSGAKFRLEVLRAAPDLGDDEAGHLILALWPELTPTERVPATEALLSRPTWAAMLLGAVEAKRIDKSALPMTVARSFAKGADAVLKKRAEQVLGVWHESNADTKALIATKRKACLEGTPDIAAGKVLFQTACIVCHSFHGGGQKVGPDLIGSGRSNLDAILSNVIDPNQIIGNGYENFIVTTKDNRTLSGRVTEDTPTHVKLLAIGGAEQTVPRDQVAKLENTHQSLMPVGFGALPDDQFRNLVWYVLAPPEEGPLTPEKKKLLSTSIDESPAPKHATGNYAIDWEGVSLWNPQWKVIAPEFERTPLKLGEYYGRRNVLLMHPFPDKKTPTALERKFTVDASKHMLKFAVAADDRGDWELVVKADGMVLKKMPVNHDKPRWQEIGIDLGAYAGKEVTLRLEGHATGWSYEFGYWADIRME